MVTTHEKADQFEEEGYVFLPEFFDQDRIEELQEESNRILELIVNSSVANNRKSGRLSLVKKDNGEQIVKQITPSIDLTKTFHGLATTELAELIQPLLGEEPISIERTAQLNYKMPLPTPIEQLDADPADSSYPVHNDWAYYEGWLPRGIITAAVFLDDIKPESGPLEVWPGTHTDHIEHEESDMGLRVPRENIDYEGGEPVTGPAGSVLLFHSELVHSSGPNTSGHPRRLAIYGHAPKSEVESEISEQSARPEAESTYPPEMRETKYEWEYQKMKDRGEFEDVFQAPTWKDN